MNNSNFNLLDVNEILNIFNSTFNYSSGEHIKYDLSKDDDNYYVELSLPSYTKDDIDIEFENSELIISSSINEGWKKEFKKVFKIKQGVDSDEIKAELKHGILKVILPRTTESKSRKIKIK